MRTVAATCLALALAGCGGPATQPVPTPTVVPTASADAEIRERTARWAESLSADDVTAAAAVFTDDGQLSSPDFDVRTHAAIVSFMDAQLPLIGDFRITVRQVRADGERASSRGMITLSFEGGQQDSMDYQAEWVRSPAGEWQVQSFRLTPAVGM